MIVHVIGRAGSGKTTLMAEVVESINKTRTDAMANADLAPRWNSRITAVLMQAPAVVLAPKYLIHALRLRKNVSNRSKRRGLLNLLLGLSNERWRQLRNPPNRITFVDQGLTFWLNGLRDVWTEKELSALPLPDMVIQITVSPETSFERRVLRQKPPGSRELLYGSRRNAYLKEQAHGLARTGKDEREIRNLIETWNFRCSVPPLDADQVDSLLSEAVISKKEDAGLRANSPERQLERSRPLRLAYEGLGIEWITVHNDEGADLGYLASELASQILESERPISTRRSSTQLN